MRCFGTNCASYHYSLSVSVIQSQAATAFNSVNTERDYIRVTRLNEMYREELIDHRRRVSLSRPMLPFVAPASSATFVTARFIGRQSYWTLW
jgi:hypothetical protein